MQLMCSRSGGDIIISYNYHVRVASEYRREELVELQNVWLTLSEVKPGKH